jgi:hypothetical protein
MKKALLAVTALMAILVSAALAAVPAQAPSAFCKANPSLIGAGKTYATFGACVSKQAALAVASHNNAAAACKAEMADPNFAGSHDGKTFDQFYGTSSDNAKGKGNGNALGACVSQKAAAKTAAQQNALVNAARKCRTPELKTQIGSGKTYRNFGACVSAQAKSSS